MPADGEGRSDTGSGKRVRRKAETFRSAFLRHLARFGLPGVVGPASSC